MFAAFKDGLIGNFWRGGSSFNNVLWTMRTELLGSFGLFLFFHYVPRRRLEVGAMLVGAMVLLQVNSGYIGFGLGACLCLSRHAGWAPGRRTALALFAVGLLFGSWSTGFAQRHGWPWHNIAWVPGDKQSLWYPLAACWVVVGVLSLPELQRVLRTRVCQFLGFISFPLYLVHVPVVYTFTATAVLSLPWRQEVMLVPALAITLGMALPLALVFVWAVDRPTMACIRQLRRNWVAYRKVAATAA